MRTRALQLSVGLTLALAVTVAMADDMVSFATGGYASQLRTPEMMHKIDTNQDGMVSKGEWDAYQATLFEMIDADSSGALDSKEFTQAHRNDVVSFATGGYANALRRPEMFAKIDADHDGQVTREEFVVYHAKLFEMMDTGQTHMLGQNEFFGRGPAR
ncbi:MAG TPA: EF-hand domain-containing protein [Polyangiaceae bacterium]|nr:EF-hand domain-containing protein [Polyangiaceae bacterium]